MTTDTITIGTKELTTHTHEDASSGTALTYVYRGLDLVATVETSVAGPILYGRPEAHGIDRAALKRAFGVGA